MWACGFGLKLSNWVKYRPGICEGGASSSTGPGNWERWSTQGCLGLTLIRGSKQWEMDSLPIFLLRSWSNLQMCIASLASWVEPLSIMAKLVTEGKGWWKSVQCLIMADVVDLTCSLALSLREHEVSPHRRIYIHPPGIASGILVLLLINGDLVLGMH